MCKKGYVSLLLALAAVLVLAPAALTAQTAPREAQQAALDGFPALLQDYLQAIGHPELADTEVVLDLNKSFRVHIVDPRAILEKADIAGAAAPIEQYCFLAMRGTSPVGLLTVEMIDGRWQAADFGAAQMAVEVNQVFDAWPAEKGYAVRYLRVNQAMSDLFEITDSQQRKGGIIPLTSARISLGLDQVEFSPVDVLSDTDAIHGLQKAVRRNLDKPVEN